MTTAPPLLRQVAYARPGWVYRNRGPREGRQDLAGKAASRGGAAPAAVQRALKTLGRHGAIVMERARVSVRDLDVLRRWSDAA